jgi:hypothetical protein
MAKIIEFQKTILLLSVTFALLIIYTIDSLDLMRCLNAI